jgi:hypothetical protein
MGVLQHLKNAHILFIIGLAGLISGASGTWLHAEEPQVFSLLSGVHITHPHSNFLEHLKFNFSWENDLGIGTFVENDGARNPYWAQSFMLNVAYTIRKNLSLSSTIQNSVEMTDPDNSTGKHYKFDLWEVRVKKSKLFSIPFLQLTSDVSLGATIPVSIEARTATEITSLRPAITFSLPVWIFSLSYESQFRRYFYRYSSPIGHNSDSSDYPMSYTLKSPGKSDEFLIPGMNLKYLFRNRLALSADILKNVSSSVSFGIYNLFAYQAYDSSVDAAYYTPEYAQTGLGQNDMMEGSISLQYAMAEHTSLSFGTATFQPVFSTDNKSLRFPFYDLDGPANNFTQWFLSLDLSY